MNTVFLETTIQADRNYSYMKERDIINKKLAGKRLISSSYVLGELKSNFLRQAITFYNLLQECDTTNEALVRLRLFSTRQYNRVLKIFNILTEDGNMAKKDVEVRLNMLIEDLFISRFNRNLEKNLIDETKCERANAVPEYIDGLWNLKFNCKATMKDKCGICELFQKYSIEINTICELNDNNLLDMITILNEIKNDNIKPYGKRCWKIGDVIICAEAPNDCEIYTTNIKDYNPLCSAFSKKLFL